MSKILKSIKVGKMKGRMLSALVLALILTLLGGSLAIAATPPLLPFDGTGDLFVLNGGGEEEDGGNSNILRITPAGVVTVEVTEAEIMAATGEGSVYLHDDGIAFDAAGAMYFAESDSDDILKKAPGGAVTVLTTREAIMAATGETDADPDGLAFGSDGFLYIVEDDYEHLLRVNPTTGAVSVYVNKTTFDALAGITNTDLEAGIVGDEAGNIYVVTEDNPNAILKIAPGGTPSVLVSGSPFNDLDVFMTRAPNGDLIVADDSGADTIYRVTPAGVVTTFLSKATLEAVAGQDVDLEGGIAFDSAGNFYVAEENTDDILKFTPGLIGSTWVTEEAMEAVSGVGEVDLDGGIAFASAPPLADFTAVPRQGPALLTVQFTDLSIGAITSWLWDFGDGGASREQHPSYIYNFAGTYTVSLTVTNPIGTDQEVKTDYIEVIEEVAPARIIVRNLLIQPAQAYPGDQVTISADVVNQGGIRDSKDIELVINGQAEQSTRVGVDPGAAQHITFTTSKTVPGTYEVYIEGQASAFNVLLRPHVASTEADGGLGTGAVIAIVVIGVIFLVGMIIVFIFVRRSA